MKSLRYDCIYVGAGCDLDKTLAYLQDLLNVGGVMVAPFGDELVRMEVSFVPQESRYQRAS